MSNLECRLATLDQDGGEGDLAGLRSVLIDAGELVAGLADAESGDEADDSAINASLGEALLSLAEPFVALWCGSSCSRVSIVHALERLEALHRYGLPESVDASIPEGFAFYGLFPETYADATMDLLRQRRPKAAVVIGIRSIGTTLSAVVAATLRLRGVAVECVTVRPRGHPFDRQLRLSSHLSARLRTMTSRPDTLFAIVDEGPGLSGSSFASVVEQLTSLGAPDDRIVLFPSWRAAAESLSSERARRVWNRHQQFVGDFDRAWVRSGRLARAFDAEFVRELSAGQWRSMFFEESDDMPAVQPQHERRKLLAQRTNGEQLLIKFEGLDHGASRRRAKAARLADAGYGPPVHHFAHGFLATSWVEGSPLAAGDATPELVRRVARYLAWTFRCERVGHDADPVPLVEMSRVNADEGLGTEWGATAVRHVRTSCDAVGRMPAVRIDGRMLPHEWLRTPDGYLKTDGGSHYDDHFYPGATDIAWDVAAAIIELDLRPPAERMLIREYQLAAGDGSIEQRLPFMRAAYLAYRLGYTSMAANALAACNDATRMRTAARKYVDLLRRELSADRIDGQSCATGT